MVLKITTIPLNPANEELRRLKSLHRLTSKDIIKLLTTKYGGPAKATVDAWLSDPNTQTNYNKIPPATLELLKIKLGEIEC